MARVMSWGRSVRPHSVQAIDPVRESVTRWTRCGLAHWGHGNETRTGGLLAETDVIQ